MTVTLERVTRAVDGIPTIRDVSLTLERGTLSVLLGPTLSGKTSIMRLLAGLDKPTTGRVLVDGKDVTGFDVRKRSVAMVYQQFINYPSLTVYENIASPLRVQGKPRAEIESRVQEAAKLLKLEPYLNRTPLQLSGGQQQRTAIARALVKGADLVLLDEPLANLDYKLREELRTELPRIFEASGAIFVYQCRRAMGRQCAVVGGGVSAKAKVRLVQGSHIVVPQALRARPRLHVPECRRPHHLRHSLSGGFHPDRHHRSRLSWRSGQGESDDREEIDYLCTSASEYLAKPVTPADVVWSYAGVRPLYDDGASEAKAATRDYVFELDTPGGAPLLSIYGGKITTYRRLAEEALRTARALSERRQGPRRLDRQGAAARRRHGCLGDRRH